MTLQLQGQLLEARMASQVLQQQLEEEQEGRARLLEDTAYAQESAASVEAALRAELEAAQARQIVMLLDAFQGRGQLLPILPLWLSSGGGGCTPRLCSRGCDQCDSPLRRAGPGVG